MHLVDSNDDRPAWRTREWQDAGDEPDYRFTLANERTFLAWVRTALAVLAAAVAVAQLVPHAGSEPLRRAVGALLTVLGLASGISAYPRWAANQRAMRLGRPLPKSRLLPLVSVALVLVGIGAFVLVVAG
jgi:putative membrane protein